MAEIDRFQHYQVLRHPDGALWELGRGAMGITYKASDTSLRSQVALKVISSQYLNSETARQRFLREARAAAQLRHPNVATVFHLGDADGTFFYAMEFVDGETVERRVQREGPLRVDVALRITRQVARALIAADRQHLVHRDIKPANIMLVRDEDEDHLLVKVIDFGLAKSLVSAADQSVTVTLGGFVGTPHFASPEQLEEREIDIRSDIYSLGASLWYMLSGRPPFQGSLASVIHQHLGSALPADVLAAVPPRVAELLQAMLAKRPEQRIQTPADLKQRLDDLITELRGLSPTLVLGGQPGTGGGGGSSAMFATGQVIRGRYQLLGRAPNDRTLYQAKDLQTNRTVTLRPLASGVRHDPARLEAVRQEVQRVENIHHPNVISGYGLEIHDAGAMLVSDWAAGFTLQELLRVRRELTWDETDRLLRPVASLLDFLADRQLSFHALQLRSILVQPAAPVDSPESLLRLNVADWPPFNVKVDPLSATNLDEVRAVEPTQTLVDLSTSDIAPRPVQQAARLAYELLGGVRAASAVGLGSQRFTPLANLSEFSNSVLRQALNEPERFPSALDFLSELAEAQRPGPPMPGAGGIRAAPTVSGAALPAGKGPRGGNPKEIRGAGQEQLPAATEEADAEARSSATGRLLQLVTALIALLLVGALGALLVTNWVGRKPAAPVPELHQGSFTLNTKPEGATVKFNGQELGKTPLTAVPLPSGKQTLQLELPGYQTRSVEIAVTDGSLNNLGLLPLQREVGQVVVKSDPPGTTFELVGPDGRVTSGVAPVTLDNLPVGHYVIHLHYPGGESADQELDVAAGKLATVERAVGQVKVSLKSDPVGATIYLGSRELGKTPVTVMLPPDNVELISKCGALAPVTQTVKPNPDGSTVVEFKHAYGTVLVSSDRPDAQVSVDGTDMGKAPIQAILPPGHHQVTVRADGVPDQTRPAEVRAAGKVNLAFDFSPAAEVLDAAAAQPAASDGESTNPSAPPLRAETPTPTRSQAANAEERRARRRQAAAPVATPVYHSEEEYKRAREQAYDRFDAEWEARKRALEREKDYYDYQIDHSSGPAKERWKYKKEVTKQRMDQLDDQKDAAKHDLKRHWNDD